MNEDHEYYIGDVLITYDDIEPYSDIGERVGEAVANALTEEPMLMSYGYDVDEAVAKEHAANLGFGFEEGAEFEWGYIEGFQRVCERRWSSEKG